MKKQNSHILILAFLILVGTANQAMSQCATLYYFQQGRVVKMDTYDKNGEKNGEMDYTVQSVETTGKTTKATVQSQFLNKKGKKLVETAVNYTCTNNTVEADMSTYVPSASLQAFKNGKTTFSGSNLAYPAKLSIGQTLPDGTFKATTDMGVIKQTLTVSITDRKVTGKEKIVIAGKSWDCYKISYTNTIALKSMISNNHTLQTTEWYCPDFGVLKTDSGDMGRTEVTYISTN